MGTTLETLLAQVDTRQIQRLWLDFRNLNQKNHQAAIKRLNELDQRYGIKRIALVGSDSRDEFFIQVKLDGWQTSYYLPTRVTAGLIENKDEEGMEQLAQKIAQQIAAQQTDGISLDEKLYPFVKNHLEKMIDPEVRYHAWMGPDFVKRKFSRNLEDDKLFKDDRVESILVNYESRFTL